ncbi:hypothetical protein BKA58DRAFT_468116, partial [Alternaria rosae]|uniref:uncharacterized protein n=1 Tax=Alternaria rosae TaxID=1187941 RepID=UPI001E8D06AE
SADLHYSLCSGACASALSLLITASSYYVLWRRQSSALPPASKRILRSSLYTLKATPYPRQHALADLHFLSRNTLPFHGHQRILLESSSWISQELGKSRTAKQSWKSK